MPCSQRTFSFDQRRMPAQLAISKSGDAVRAISVIRAFSQKKEEKSRHFSATASNIDAASL
jgi:hypothetical protein